MAKFPISFTTPARRRSKTKTPKRLLRSANDTEFQKALAFISYYVLVFVAVCMFMPAKVAYAADSIKSIIA